ncbi:LuxR family transcriptional regulator [Rathayibacter sp. SD072]|uniref:helix-turn-helix transcriptional regulator n=1 Tax=Rathayibacter sp. SD072 TaxID=2781731 RepID=UPI001A95D507|nr:LuxR family transcriptional regulator [Rathayibacter sp. SD072]MBO0985142.1 hypothetical protein [Rathayibacter sp. SD072]
MTTGARGARLTRAVEAGDWVAVQELLRSSWTHLAQSEPAGLLDALERMPEEVMDRSPRLRIAMVHLGRTLHGDAWIDPAPGRRPLPLPMGPADQLGVWAARGSAARAKGRLDDAFRLMESGQDLLRRLPPIEEASISAGLPEILQEWALTCEQDSRLEDALALHLSAHEWSAVIGHRGMAAATAGSAAYLHAVAGRNMSAAEWLARVPDTEGILRAPGSDVAGVLAEALLRIDHFDPEGAVSLLDGLDGAAAGERGPAVDFVRAFAAAGRPFSSHLVRRRIDATLAATGPRSGRGQSDLVRAIHAFTGGPAEAEPIDDTVPLVARIAAATEALAANLRGDESTARRLAGPLLDSGESPRVLITALLASSAHPTRTLEEAAALAHAHDSFGVLALLPADRRRRVADELASLGDHGIARILRDSDAPRASDLSPVHREIAFSAAQGATLADIADERGVSVNTVKTQLRTVYRRLGVRSRSELAAALDGVRAPRSEA